MLPPQIQRKERLCLSAGDEAWIYDLWRWRRTWALENLMARFALLPLAVMLMAEDSPAEQEVPAASCWTTDQVPLPHCWNDVPPMQFHIPSVVQALPAACTVPEPVVPVDVPELGAGEAEEATGLATGATLGADATGAADTTGSAGATGAWVASLAADVGTVAKTPPGIPPAAVVGLGEAAAEVAPDPDPAVAVGFPATADPQLPVGACKALEVAEPSRTTESPGLGNLTSVESTVPHPFPMLAMNMSGRALKAAWSRSMS